MRISLRLFPFHRGVAATICVAVLTLAQLLVAEHAAEHDFHDVSELESCTVCLAASNADDALGADVPHIGTLSTYSLAAHAASADADPFRAVLNARAPPRAPPFSRKS